MSRIPQIASCTTTECAFNHDGCAAFAMTMGRQGCTTFIALDSLRGGLEGGEAKVGACQRADCTFNEALVCSAPRVAVDGRANCLTYRHA